MKLESFIDQNEYEINSSLHVNINFTGNSGRPEPLL